MARFLIALAYYFLYIGAIFSFASITCVAQCDSAKQYLLNIGSRAMSTGGTPNSGVPINEVSADYTFYSVSDSAVVKCWVSNITHNSKRVFLANWCQGKTTDISNATPPESRTHTFTLQPGDRVGMFREFWWYEPHTNIIDPNSYNGSTDVAYSFELLDAVSGERIAQLDTIFLRAKNQSSLPYFVSAYPAIASIEYIYPDNASERNVILAISAKQSGASLFPLYRIDGLAVSHTQDLNLASWKKYATDLESATIAPRSIILPAQALSLSSSRNLLQVAGRGTLLDIIFTKTPPPGSIIGVADIYGRQHIQLPISDMRHTVEMSGPGIYVVALYNAGGIAIETHKIYLSDTK